MKKTIVINGLKNVMSPKELKNVLGGTGMFGECCSTEDSCRGSCETTAQCQDRYGDTYSCKK